MDKATKAHIKESTIFRVSIIGYALLIYLLASGYHGVLIWLLIALLILERIFVEVVIRLVARMVGSRILEDIAKDPEGGI